LFKLEFTGQFKRDVKRLEKQGLAVGPLIDVIKLLESGTKLPGKYLDHKLKGNKKPWHECHVTNDLLLIYLVNVKESIVILGRVGSHADLF